MPTKTKGIKNMREVQPHGRCPKCGSLSLKRESIPHEGLPLFDLKEQCGKCRWHKVWENVRAS